MEDYTTPFMGDNKKESKIYWELKTKEKTKKTYSLSGNIVNNKYTFKTSPHQDDDTILLKDRILHLNLDHRSYVNYNSLNHYIQASGSNIFKYIWGQQFNKEWENEYTFKNMVDELISYLYPGEVKLELRKTKTRLHPEFYIKGEKFKGFPPQLFYFLNVVLALRREDKDIVIIENIDYYLDPRLLHFIKGELERETYILKTKQVFLTSSNPYFLDLLPLESIVYLDKKNKIFKPSDVEIMTKWGENFNPGRLWTMGVFERNAE